MSAVLANHHASSQVIAVASKVARPVTGQEGRIVSLASLLWFIKLMTHVAIHPAKIVMEFLTHSATLALHPQFLITDDV